MKANPHIASIDRRKTIARTHVSIQRVNDPADVDDALEIIDRDGAVVISQILSRPSIVELNGEVDSLFNRSTFCGGMFFGRKTKRIHSLVAKSYACQKMAAHPIILRIMNKILAPFCDKIQINLTQGIQIWPGEAAQLLHRDDSMFPANVRTCEFMANVMWACGQFTPQNGGTVVALGSHKWQDKERQPAESDLVQAEMEPGDALIYLGSLIHGGGENRSSAPRTGVAIGYCLGWLRQYENQYFAAPPEIARHFPTQLQDLLGYSVHRPNLGMYEGNEPKILFDNPDEREIVTQDWLTPKQKELVSRHVANRQT